MASRFVIKKLKNGTMTKFISIYLHTKLLKFKSLLIKKYYKIYIDV